MLKKRLIPVLIYNDGKLVQSINFKHPMGIGNALTKISFFNTWSVDEIILIDVTREKKNRKYFYDAIETLSKKSFLPLTVGGWIETIEEIRQILMIGADKIIINTKAFKQPEFLEKSARTFGSQCIVVSIDVKKFANSHKVFIDRGRVNTGLDVEDWSREVEKIGAGEIFLTSIDNDGSRNGYDLDLMKKVSSSVKIPIIGFGGVWTWDHLVDGILKGGLDAVGVGNVFHFKEHSTKQAKKYLLEKGINVRKDSFFKIKSNFKPSYDDVL
tara:strand:- start:20498 stop:21307 length:810 start_codon:yes stop_codon:yes gene_type:complete